MEVLVVVVVQIAVTIGKENPQMEATVDLMVVPDTGEHMDITLEVQVAAELDKVQLLQHLQKIMAQDILVAVAVAVPLLARVLAGMVLVDGVETMEVAVVVDLATLILVPLEHLTLVVALVVELMVL
jgi:hypothetical protein